MDRAQSGEESTVAFKNVSALHSDTNHGSPPYTIETNEGLKWMQKPFQTSGVPEPPPSLLLTPALPSS